MAIYRCYFLGSNGQLVGAETIVGGDDKQAVMFSFGGPP